MAIGQAAVLYTEQALTAEEAGQVYTNLSPTGGAEGIARFKVADVGAYGSQWMNGADVWGGIWHDLTNGKMHLEFRQRFSLVPVDDTIAGTTIQLGGTQGSAGTDIVFVPSQGASSAGATLKNSQTFMLDIDYWSGARVSGGVLFNAIALDTSGNAALRITPDNLNGSVTNAVVFHIPDGTAALPSLGFTSAATMGIRKDSNDLVLQYGSDAAQASVRLSNGGIANGGELVGGSAVRFRTGYFDSTSTCSLSLYYTNAGFSVVSASEWYGVANGSKIFSVLSAGVRVESGKTLQLGNAAAASVGTASTHKLRLLDSTGTAYDVLAIAA